MESGHKSMRARELPVGMRLGRYTLLHRIAHGGMAELYLASSRGVAGFRKLVALKLVLPHLADDASFVGMLLDEARLAARLDHPNIAHVIDLGEAEGEHYMAMEYVHGQDLRAVLADASKSEGFPLECGLAVVIAACYGLDYAHEFTDDQGAHLGIVHRDVSPSNLIVRYDGCVKLVDFGIAKAADRYHETRTGMLKGKSGYMSPEQARGEPLDRRSDIFCLGILLYEVTTSERLFYGHNEFAVLNRICDAQFDRPTQVVSGYPPELERIVLRALAPDAGNRYATARQLRADLDRFVASHGMDVSPDRIGAYMRTRFGEPAPPQTVVSQVRARKRRPPRWVLPAVAVGVSVGAAGFFAGRPTGSKPEPTSASIQRPRTTPSQEGSESGPSAGPATEPTTRMRVPTNDALPGPVGDTPAGLGDGAPAELDGAPAELDGAPVSGVSGEIPEAAPATKTKRKPKRRKRPRRQPRSDLDSMMPR